MNTFLLNKTQVYVDRLREYSSLLNYIHGYHDGLTIINGMNEIQLLLY